MGSILRFGVWGLGKEGMGLGYVGGLGLLWEVAFGRYIRVVVVCSYSMPTNSYMENRICLF